MEKLLNPYFIALLIFFISAFAYVARNEQHIPGLIFFIFASLGAVLDIGNLGQVGMLKALILMFLGSVLLWKKMQKSENLPYVNIGILILYLLGIYVSGTINHLPLSNYRAELGLIIMAMVIALAPNRADTLKMVMVGVFLWGLINAIVVVLAKLGFRWGGMVLFNEGGRAIGLSRHSTSMGAYFSIALVAAQILVIQAQTKWMKVVLFCCGLLIMLGLLATIARGAFVGWLAAFLYIQYRIQGMKLNTVIGIFIAGLIGLFVASMLGLDELLIGRFTNIDEDSSAQARIPLLIASLEMVANHLFLGTGIGYVDESMRLQSHNMFMQVLVESGVIGFSLFMLLLWKSGWTLLRRSNINYSVATAQHDKGPDVDDILNPSSTIQTGVTLRKRSVKSEVKIDMEMTKPYYIGLVAMLGAILLNSLTHSFDFFVPVWLLIGIGLMREEA